MEETFKESVIEKIGQIEKQVLALSKDATAENDIKEQQESIVKIITALNSGLSQLNNNARMIRDAAGRMSDLNKKLNQCIHALENPVEKEAHHIHHFRWPLGVAVGVSLLLILAVSGLYVNHQKQKQYLASDTKYRSLKLMENQSLQALLFAEDSTYRADPGMRKQVLEQEAENERKLELLRQAREKRQEAGELEKKAGRAG